MLFSISVIYRKTIRRDGFQPRFIILQESSPVVRNPQRGFLEARGSQPRFLLLHLGKAVHRFEQLAGRVFQFLQIIFLLILSGLL